jgi:methyl-accepting chemotaxis protein
MRTKKRFSMRANHLVILSTLVLLVVGRLLPADALQDLDALLGRSGDALLLLVFIMLMLQLLNHYVVVKKASKRAHKVPEHEADKQPVQAVLQAHLELDQEIDAKFVDLMGDTELSAIGIIKQVSQLYEAANQVLIYIDHTNPQANDLGQEIIDSVSYLMEIGQLVEQLPAKMTRDMEIVQNVVKEINTLSALVGAVQAISMQSHLLAINAAIEGSRAGPSGAAFRIVAQEMRILASNSSDVATKIDTGLSRARHVVEDGMSTNQEDTKRQLHLATHAVVSIKKLQDNFEDMSQYFKTRFSVLSQHNHGLAKEISEVLGLVQTQDVVSQCIDRIRNAIGERNALLQSLSGSAAVQEADATLLVQELARIRDAFVQEEDKHMHSARHQDDAGSEPKFELF